MSTSAIANTRPERPSMNSNVRCAASLTYLANPAGLATTGNTKVASESFRESRLTQGRDESSTKSSPHHRALTRVYGGHELGFMNHSKLRTTSSTWPVSLEEVDERVVAVEALPAFGGRLAPVANLPPNVTSGILSRSRPDTASGRDDAIAVEGSSTARVQEREEGAHTAFHRPRNSNLCLVSVPTSAN